MARSPVGSAPGTCTKRADRLQRQSQEHRLYDPGGAVRGFIETAPCTIRLARSWVSSTTDKPATARQPSSWSWCSSDRSPSNEVGSSGDRRLPVVVRRDAAGGDGPLDLLVDERHLLALEHVLGIGNLVVEHLPPDARDPRVGEGDRVKLLLHTLGGGAEEHELKVGHSRCSPTRCREAGRTDRLLW